MCEAAFTSTPAMKACRRGLRLSRKPLPCRGFPPACLGKDYRTHPPQLRNLQSRDLYHSFQP